LFRFCDHKLYAFTGSPTEEKTTPSENIPLIYYIAGVLAIIVVVATTIYLILKNRQRF